MSAVPKKKLCWNCEGNVAKDINNCPYCGVYLHGTEGDDDTLWNPNYSPKLKSEEEIPAPLYQIKTAVEQTKETPTEQFSNSPESLPVDPLVWHHIYAQLKQDVFPILFLMMGSIFFLFGIVLLLFARNGTLTLQWQERDGLFFFIAALPLIFLGWRYFQKMDEAD